MLIFANVALFESIYDCAKKLYPELNDTFILVDYTDSKTGVLLLEGTDEDAGKYKIAVCTSEDERVNASFFIGGLSMLIYKLKYDKFVHPASSDTEFVPDERYKEIFKAIVKAFEHEPYHGEYAHE